MSDAVTLPVWFYKSSSIRTCDRYAKNIQGLPTNPVPLHDFTSLNSSPPVTDDSAGFGRDISGKRWKVWRKYAPYDRGRWTPAIRSTKLYCADQGVFCSSWRDMHRSVCQMNVSIIPHVLDSSSHGGPSGPLLASRTLP